MGGDLSPVTTAQSTAATLPTDSIMTESCSVVDMCTSYTEGLASRGPASAWGLTADLPQDSQPHPATERVTVPGIPSPPYTSETEVNGCKDLEAAGASGLAALVTTTCLDGAARDLKCAQPYATVLTGGPLDSMRTTMRREWPWAILRSNRRFPIWDGTRWVVILNVTGNSAGEDKWLHKCWLGEDRALRVDSGEPDGLWKWLAGLLQ